MSAVNQRGKYQPYPDYKDSEVEWLGVVPKHWELHRIKDTASVLGGYPFDSKKFDPDSGVPLVRIRDISAETTAVRFNGEIPSSAMITNGDVLVGMDGDFNVASWQGQDAALNQRVACVRGKSGSLSRFMLYLLPFNMKVVNDLTYYTTVKHLSLEDIEKTIYALPPQAELDNVLAFLDYETARIDQLIAKQQQLIELLKEKRQAVISHAVTKGLNPNAPMKDSGVEWLGQVPEHWVVTQLRHLLCHLEQGKSPECEARMTEGEEWGVLKTGCVNGGVYRATEHKALPVHIAPHKAYEVRAGDLLMSRASGSRDLIGAVAYIDKTPPRLLLSDKVFRLILVSGVHPQYLSLLMGSKSVRSQIELAINGAEGLANNITKESIKSFLVACPDYEEQLQIHKYLSEQLNQFDSLEAKLTEALVLLQERRTALISAAVTGKIDLRGWQPPKREVAA